MTHRTPRTALLAALLIAPAAALAGCGSAATPAHPSPTAVSVTVASSPVGAPLPPGFVGLSLEYPALPAYAKTAVFRLIRRLAPGQEPVLRIGGNSSDQAWWPQPGESVPRGARYALGERWLRAAHTLATATHAKMIMGLNLAAGVPGVAAAEARAFERGLGPRYVDAFEIGNEPDLYGLFPWPAGGGGQGHLRRPAGYSLRDYTREFSRWRAAVGHRLPIAGPAFATFDWSLGRFIAAEPGLKLVTFHHYPLDACLTKRSANGYPTMASLLSDHASAGLARQLAPGVAAAHAHRVRFRLDELNSASCGGKPGVSDTPASGLWMLDTLFDLAKVGVDGVNVHTFPGAAYAPFSADGYAYPEYYGMLMFTQAFPPGARLLPVAVSPAGALTAWATSGPKQTIRVVLINKSPRRAYRVQLRAPGLPASVMVKRLGGGGSNTVPASSIVVPAQSAVLITR